MSVDQFIANERKGLGYKAKHPRSGTHELTDALGISAARAINSSNPGVLTQFLTTMGGYADMAAIENVTGPNPTVSQLSNLASRHVDVESNFTYKQTNSEIKSGINAFKNDPEALLHYLEMVNGIYGNAINLSDVNGVLDDISELEKALEDPSSLPKNKWKQIASDEDMNKAIEPLVKEDLKKYMNQFKSTWTPEHTELYTEVITNNYKSIGEKGLKKKFISEALKSKNKQFGDTMSGGLNKFMKQADDLVGRLGRDPVNSTLQYDQLVNTGISYAEQMKAVNERRATANESVRQMAPLLQPIYERLGMA